MKKTYTYTDVRNKHVMFVAVGCLTILEADGYFLEANGMQVVPAWVSVTWK